MEAKRPMSDAHKAALAKGRSEGRVVRDYLEGLRATKPKRGRKRTPDTISARLLKLEAELAAASPPVKKRVLGAAIVAVAADRNVTATEAELLRVIADSLDCPIPPLAVGPIPADM